MIKRLLSSLPFVLPTALLLLLTLTASPVQAAEGVNLVTSPLPVSVSATPGTSTSTNLRIKNGGPKTERLKVSLLKFTAYGEDGSPALVDRQPGDDYFDWVSFDRPVFDAPPGEWQTIKMNLALPKSAAFGYYYAVAFSRSNEEKPIPGKAAAINGSTAILVLLDAKVPNAKRSLVIKDYSADRSFYEFLPTKFTTKIHNDGNTHTKPFGNIFIYQGKKKVASLDFNPGSGTLLPGTNRIFEVKWADGFPVYTIREEDGKVARGKDGKPIQSIKWDLSQAAKLRFGHYTAKLALAYDNGTGDVPLEGSLSFWVLPWRLVLGGIAVLAFAAIGIFATFGRPLWRIISRRRKS